MWVLDLKAMLPVLELEDSAPVYDAGVAGYLLNPLKIPTIMIPLQRITFQKTCLPGRIFLEKARSVICWFRKRKRRRTVPAIWPMRYGNPQGF